MRKLKFLILTDHRGHSEQNSLYALTRKLAADARTAFAFVVSRADARNTLFFSGELDAPLYGLIADENFTFDSAANQFQRSDDHIFYGEADVVWLRLPPPADRLFFANLTSFAPADAPDEQPLIINNPAGILETGSKAFLLNFSEFTAPARRVHSNGEVMNFAARHPIVLKPLEEYGGRGLVRVLDEKVEEDGQQYPLNEWLDRHESDILSGKYLAMKFLKNVSEGDKRILVVNGQILGASLRLPAKGHWLCNVAQGGTSVPSEPTPEEEEMVTAIAPVLLEKGVVIFGVDTLVNDNGKRVLSELNTNSIGGFPQAAAQTGRPILQQTINGIYDYISGRL